MSSYPSSRTAWTTLAILILLYTSSFIDRLIVGLLIEPIKADLEASDTLMGLLVGTAFALLYTFMGLPFGRLADRFSRKRIIAAGAAAWSIFTVLCGLATTYAQLFIARVAVGIGAAALTPSAYSMISDLFAPKIRPLAMGIYVMSVAIGAGLAFMIGGFIVGLVVDAGSMTVPVFGELKPWQVAFVVAGIPGIPLALLILIAKEPARQGLMVGDDGGVQVALPIREVVGFVRERWRAYAAVVLPSCLLTMVSYAVFAWTPAYFVRVHGWTAAEAGVLFGACVLISGVTATLSGGAFCSFLVGRGRLDAYAIVLLIAACGTLPLATLGPLIPHDLAALVVISMANFSISSWGGPVAAGLQALTPNQMRAQVSALYLFCVNITGLALGPLIVGLLTDNVFRDPIGIKYSLAVTALILTPPAIGLLVVGRRHFQNGAEAAQLWSEPESPRDVG